MVFFGGAALCGPHRARARRLVGACRRRSCLMILVGMGTERFVSASAGEPERGHAVDGDDRSRLRHRRCRATGLGRRSCGASISASGTSRSMDDGPAGHAHQPARCHRRRGRRHHGGGAGALLFSHTKVGRLACGRRRPCGGAVDRHSPETHLDAGMGAAGVVALVAGMLWGARSGVQFALVWVALKALPVLIIGGFTSVPGRHPRRPDRRRGRESSARSSSARYVGGGIEGWFPYVLAVLFLLVRPEGLFGEKIIRRDLTSRNPGFRQCSTEKPDSSRPATPQDSPIFPLRQDRVAMVIMLLAAVHRSRSPPTATGSSAILIPWLVLSLVALGQNILTGLRGPAVARIGRFMAVGAFACYNFVLRVTAFRCGRGRLSAAVRGGLGRHRVRPAEPAHPRALSRGRDARVAILHRLGAGPSSAGSRTTVRRA